MCLLRFLLDPPSSLPAAASAARTVTIEKSTAQGPVRNVQPDRMLAFVLATQIQLPNQQLASIKQRLM
jgi:hypothetical protein